MLERNTMPDILAGFPGGGHLKGQGHRNLPQDLQGLCHDLHRTGCDLVIVGGRIPLDHLSADGNGAFLVHALQQTLVLLHGDLHNAVVIPQVDELDAPVIPDVLHPAGYPDGLADLPFADHAGEMIPITIC